MAMMGGEDRPESETGEKKGICGMEICVAFSCCICCLLIYLPYKLLIIPDLLLKLIDISLDLIFHMNTI